MIDTHAHLDFSQFDFDREEVISRAREAGISGIVNVGCNLESSRASLDLAGRYDFIWAGVGIHPQDASEVSDESLKILSGLAADSKVVAIGEIGLDYYRMSKGKELQKEAFRRQLRLSLELDLPVIVHCREAEDDCWQILEDEGVAQVVFHCFGSNLGFARKVWERGFWTSFTGNITYPKAVGLREVVAEMSLDRFMVETDCPFLAPQKFRGERNEPSYISEVGREIATIRGMAVSEIERLSVENAQRFFKLSF